MASVCDSASLRVLGITLERKSSTRSLVEVILFVSVHFAQVIVEELDTSRFLFTDVSTGVMRYVATQCRARLLLIFLLTGGARGELSPP